MFTSNLNPEGAVSCSPTTDQGIATYPWQSPAEVDSLLHLQATAFRFWRDLPMADRVFCYRRLVAKFRERLEWLAALITAEMGKTISASRGEIEKCASTIEWIAEHGPGILMDETVAVEGKDRVRVSYRPLGTILGIMPWNFPFWQVIRASGPILLSGNAFLLKHASNVMGSAFALQTLFDEAGFPPNLFACLNVENDQVARIIEDPRIAAVTLTGGMRAGSAVAALAGKALKKSLLELGGSDAFIVLADANIDLAVKAGIEARFQNAGQVCLAAKRFILEASIAEEFSRKFTQAAALVKVGDPFDPSSLMGPMARADLRDDLHRQVEESIAQGATLLLGGRRISGKGNFYEPTVLSHVVPGMPAFDEETFGPLAALIVARDLNHAIELANASDYGLSANLWTKDMQRAQAAASQIEAGGVFINGFSASNPRIPVGGIKKSGYGRELSHFGLKEFTNAQVVWETHREPT